MKTSCNPALMCPFCKFCLFYYHYYAVILDMLSWPLRHYFVFIRDFAHSLKITSTRHMFYYQDISFPSVSFHGQKYKPLLEQINSNINNTVDSSHRTVLHKVWYLDHLHQKQLEAC